YLVWLVTVLAAPQMALPQTKDDPELRLQAAIQTETVDGDLKSAIEQYKKIAARAGSNRGVAAKALLRLAACYQKVGDAEARKVYERIVRDYADQKEAAAVARQSLGQVENGRAAAASFRRVWTLPPGTNVRTFERVAPDGRYFPYTTYDTQKGDLFLHDLLTGADRRLTNTGSASRTGTSVPSEQFCDGETAFSPDSKQLAYTWHTEKDLYEIRL